MKKIEIVTRCELTSEEVEVMNELVDELIKDVNYYQGLIKNTDPEGYKDPRPAYNILVAMGFKGTGNYQIETVL